MRVSPCPRSFLDPLNATVGSWTFDSWHDPADRLSPDRQGLRRCGLPGLRPAIHGPSDLAHPTSRSPDLVRLGVGI